MERCDLEKKKRGRKSLTQAQETFAKAFASTGRLTESYRLAYPNNHGQYVYRDASRLLKNPKIQETIEKIQQDCRAQFIFMAPTALERLEDLAINAGSEKVKLQANVEILDRAGLKPPEKVELSHLGAFGAASLEEIKEMIRANIEGSTKGKEDKGEKSS
jgi:hypothetical protein